MLQHGTCAPFLQLLSSPMFTAYSLAIFHLCTCCFLSAWKIFHSLLIALTHFSKTHRKVYLRNRSLIIKSRLDDLLILLYYLSHRSLLCLPLECKLLGKKIYPRYLNIHLFVHPTFISKQLYNRYCLRCLLHNSEQNKYILSLYSL